jgi:hypothetical protein
MDRSPLQMRAFTYTAEAAPWSRSNPLMGTRWLPSSHDNDNKLSRILEEQRLMVWGRIALLREGESPILPGKKSKKKGRGLLVGCFYTTLNLEVGKQYLAPLTCELGGGALEPREEKSQAIPNLACLKLPLKNNIPKILLGGCWRSVVHLL